MRLTAIVLAFALLGVAPATAQTPADKADAALATITAQSPGLAVLVSKGGQPIYERYLGAADIEQGRPVTAATRFHVASVSKQFTAFAIMQLARAGKVDLDADIHTYLPDLPNYGAKITVSDLVHHTSGLRDQWELFILSGTNMQSLLRQSAILSLAKNQTGLNFAPGTDYRYCNTGYSLLAEIVAKVSGKSFPAYLKDHVFAPLGMNDTLVYADAAELVPGRAVSYSLAADGTPRLARLNYSNYGATSLHTTAADLAKWSRELLHPAAFDAALVRAVQQPGKLRNGKTINYAFGMFDDQFAGHRAITHNGADAGFRAMIASFPKEDATIVVLSNGQADVGKITRQLAGALLGAEVAPKAFAPDPGQLAKFVGFYVNDWEAGMELKVEAGKLVIYRNGQRQEATVMPDGTFNLGSAAASWTLNPDGRLDQLTTAGVSIVHRRVEKVTPAPADLEALAGRYHSDELDVTYQLKPVGPGLMLTSLRGDPVLLGAADPDHFEGGPVRLTILRDPTGKASGFAIATGRIRDLRFARTN